MRSTFLTAEWRKLILVNYAVDPAILIPYLPYKTELDYWKNKCYVSLVGFRFLNTKLKGIPIPFHRDFEEINLRFYVRFREGDQLKRGVTFIKEIVPKPALSLIANSIYKEKYITLPTRHHWSHLPMDLKVIYEWKHRHEWDMISVTAEPKAIDISTGSEEEFITEHYCGYTPVTNSLTSQYNVEHPRWKVYPIKNYQLKVRFGELYGAEFGFLKDAVPNSVMLAEGSAISVLAASKIR